MKDLLINAQPLEEAEYYFPYHRLFIELSSTGEVRDFLEWLQSDLSSLLYIHNRLYLETTAYGDKFIQITNYGYYKSWQWSLKMNKESFDKVYNHILTNWTVSPFIEPRRRSINLKQPYSYSKTIVTLTNN